MWKDTANTQSDDYRLRVLCYGYITSVLEGYWGGFARAEAHMAFIKLFSPDSWLILSERLLEILHNLDKEVGLSFNGPNGTDVPHAHRKK